MTKRAVIYARTSYDDRDTDGRNLAGQLEMGREYCRKKGYTVVSEMAEDSRGASGAEINLPHNSIKSWKWLRMASWTFWWYVSWIDCLVTWESFTSLKKN